MSVAIGVSGLARTLAPALGGSLLLGLIAAGVLLATPCRVVRLLRATILVLLLPASFLVVWPGLVRAAPPGLALRFPWPVARLVLGAAPLLLLPLLSVRLGMPSGQARAAAGLGAGPLATMRLVWLPQLGPALAVGLALAAALDVVALLVRA